MSHPAGRINLFQLPKTSGPEFEIEGDCEIAPDHLHLKDALAAPLRAGGALFFSGLSPHWTPANSSNSRRRALQFHYGSANSRIVNDEEPDALFVERDGTPASCSAASRRGF